MSEELVDRARVTLAELWECRQPCQSQPECTCERDARAAIALIRPAVLEEAAKVADHYSNYDGGRSASAIRALVKP